MQSTDALDNENESLRATPQPELRTLHLLPKPQQARNSASIKSPKVMDLKPSLASDESQLATMLDLRDGFGSSPVLRNEVTEFVAAVFKTNDFTGQS